MLIMPSKSNFWDYLFEINVIFNIIAAIIIALKSYEKDKLKSMPYWYFLLGIISVIFWFFIQGYTESNISVAIKFGFVKGLIVGCVMFIIGLVLTYLMNRKI